MLVARLLRRLFVGVVAGADERVGLDDTDTDTEVDADCVVLQITVGDRDDARRPCRPVPSRTILRANRRPMELAWA